MYVPDVRNEDEYAIAVDVRTDTAYCADMSGDPARRRPDGMPVGRPFVSGDPRALPGGGRAKNGQTARTLARAGRSKNIAALEVLRDTAEDERVRLDAAELLLRYSDGEPGVHNVPTETDEAASESGELAKVLEILSHPLPSSGLTEVAPPPVERGGDSGDEGQGNGGAA